MITINLAVLPPSHSHQEYQWILPEEGFYPFNESMDITGIFEVNNRHDNDYAFNGHILFTLNAECDRCAESFNSSFNEEIMFIIKKNSDIEDIDIIPANSNIIDLTSYIRDIILTAIPMKNLCNKCMDENETVQGGH